MSTDIISTNILNTFPTFVKLLKTKKFDFHKKYERRWSEIKSLRFPHKFLRYDSLVSPWRWNEWSHFVRGIYDKATTKMRGSHLYTACFSWIFGKWVISGKITPSHHHNLQPCEQQQQKQLVPNSRRKCKLKFDQRTFHIFFVGGVTQTLSFLGIQIYKYSFFLFFCFMGNVLLCYRGAAGDESFEDDSGSSRDGGPAWPWLRWCFGSFLLRLTLMKGCKVFIMNLQNGK